MTTTFSIPWYTCVVYRCSCSKGGTSGSFPAPTTDNNNTKMNSHRDNMEQPTHTTSASQTQSTSGSSRPTAAAAPVYKEIRYKGETDVPKPVGGGNSIDDDQLGPVNQFIPKKEEPYVDAGFRPKFKVEPSIGTGTKVTMKHQDEWDGEGNLTRTTIKTTTAPDGTKKEERSVQKVPAKEAKKWIVKRDMGIVE